MLCGNIKVLGVKHMFYYSQKNQMKNLLILIAAVAALSSCSDITRDAKKVRVKSIRFDNYKAQFTASTAVDEMIVDTIFHIGDTIQENNKLYVIVK